jgi:hypothetical protein
MEEELPSDRLLISQGAEAVKNFLPTPNLDINDDLYL